MKKHNNEQAAAPSTPLVDKQKESETESKGYEWEKEDDEMRRAYQIADLQDWEAKTGSYAHLKDSQTESKQPLYKVLNEQRTQGEWAIIEPLKMQEHRVGTKEMSIADFISVDIEDSEGEANAQYTALAVNNLHILAEALEKVACFDGVYRDAAQRADIAKSALKNIS